jgi:hypothetical protein
MIKPLKESLGPFTLQNSTHSFGLVYYAGGFQGGELTSRILRIQKQVIRLMAAVNPVTSCRQILKEMRILTVASLYILEVISYLRRYHQFVELNPNIHTYNT